MGQRNSKMRITLPTSSPPCFPFFADEKDMLQVCRKASRSLVSLRHILGIVSGLLFDPSQMSTVSMFISATATLIEFTINRLSRDRGIESSGTSTSSSVTEEEKRAATTLENTLMEMKIDKCFARAVVLSLKAKLIAIRNRYDRLLAQDLSVEDRRLEVIPALSLCEEILELFRDPENVLAKNPLVSTPFLITFGGVYVAVAELSLALLPSYRVFLRMQMGILGDTLDFYKIRCIQERQAALSLKRPEVATPGSWMEGVCQPLADDGREEEEEFYLNDPFITNEYKNKGSKRGGSSSSNNSEKLPLSPGSPPDLDKMLVASSDEFLQFESKEDAIAAYKLRLEQQYDAFFEGVLQNIDQFSRSHDDAEGSMWSGGGSNKLRWEANNNLDCASDDGGSPAKTAKIIDFFENI